MSGRSDPEIPVQGVITRIIPSSMVDGPGNRLAIFLQGCNFRCLWCHNPETMGHCSHCGTCVSACPSGALTKENCRVIWNQALCDECDRCLAVCPHSSSPKTKRLTPEQVVAEIERAQPFIRGVTISGGEATCQPDFVRTLVRLIKERTDLSILLDSNVSCPWTTLESLLPWINGVMADLKAINREKHSLLTGQTNDQVLDNLRRLAAVGKLHEVRVVVAPGFTEDDEEIRAIAEFLARLDPDLPVRLIPFRPQGVRGEASRWGTPSSESMDRLAKVASEVGLTKVKTW